MLSDALELTNETMDAKRVCKDLELLYLDGQDWGYINASPDRLREFLDYWTGSPIRQEAMVRCEFLDVIISSANAAILGGRLEPRDRADVVSAIADMRGGCLDNLQHWLALPHHDEYPVRELVLEAIRSSGTREATR